MVNMLIIILIASLMSTINCDCDTDEQLITKLYDELGCKPIKNSEANGIARSVL